MTERTDAASDDMRPRRLFLRPRSVGEGQKRQFDRTTTKRTVDVQRDRANEPIEARLVNISPTGLQLSSEESLADGESVTIEVMPGDWRSAIVRWIRANDGDVVVGAEWTETLSHDLVWQIRSYAGT